jgi:acyl carrier protein
LGLLVARLLVARGATSLVLTARHAPSAEITAVLDGLRQSGVEIVVRQGNIADPDETAALLRQIAASPFPLAGIVHAAGVVDDGVLLHQDWGRFTHVMAAKVHGSWNLHQMTGDLPLDFFVMFSSVAALMGSPGQANHAAANAFMDALASCRRADGLPALSINWGAWGEVGAAVTLGVGQRLAHKGIHGIRSDDGIEILERLLFAEHKGDRLPAQVGVVAVAWQVFMAQSSNRESARLSDFAMVNDEPLPAKPGTQVPVSAVDVRTLQQIPPADRRSALARAIGTRLAHSLGLDASAPIEEDRPFVDFGLDSLLAVELRGLIGSAFAITLPATIMFDYPTIESLSDYLGREVLRIEPWLAAKNLAVASPVAADDALSSIEEMSDEEVERLLAGRLAGEAN